MTTSGMASQSDRQMMGENKPPEQPGPGKEWDETALHRAFGGDVG